MRGAPRPLFAVLLAIVACALVLAEQEGQPMTEYLKEGILAGGRRGNTAAGAYSWGDDGASSNRAGNDEALYETSFDLGEPNAPLNENQILKKQINELKEHVGSFKQRIKELEAQNSLDLAQDVGELPATQKEKGVVNQVKDLAKKDPAKILKTKLSKAATKAATKHQVAGPSNEWSAVALKLAKQVNEDWAKSTEGEATCKALLEKAKKCHECDATTCKRASKDCELADRTQFKTDWVKRRFIGTHWDQLDWYQQANSYHVPGDPSVLTHRAGLHALSSGFGDKSYVCASWTAVCTKPKTLAQAQCRSARLILGGARAGGRRFGNGGCEWVSAETMGTHADHIARIVLPQFG